MRCSRIKDNNDKGKNTNNSNDDTKDDIAEVLKSWNWYVLLIKMRLLNILEVLIRMTSLPSQLSNMLS